jgi:GNAT superfamily N-acetyltransferase
MTGHDPVPRLATSADAEAISDAHIRGWQTAYRGLVPDALLDGFSMERRTAWWRDHLQDPAGLASGSTTWVVEAPDGVAGFVFAGPARDEPVAPPPGAGEVYAIYLRPERRGQGYGRTLFAAATADLERRGLRPLVVWVFEANPVGRRFYEAAGFRPDGARHQIDFDGIVLTEIRYRRPAA